MQSRLIIDIMKTSDVIAYFGSIAATAAALNCHRNSIYQWGEEVPPARQFELEVKTGGALVSDYSLAAEKPPGRHKKRKK